MEEWKNLSESLNDFKTAFLEGLAPVLEPIINFLAKALSRFK